MPPPMRPNPARALNRLQQGTYSAFGEKLAWTYYDTATLLAATTTFRLFTVGLGGGAVPKTLDITNMQQGGQIPQGQHLDVEAIGVWYTGSAAKATADLSSLNLFLAHSTIEFLIPGKDTVGTWRLQELFGRPISFSVTPAVTINHPVLSEGIFTGMKKLKTKIPLAALTPFELKLTNHVATAAGLDADLLCVGLVGTLYRAS